MKLLNRLLPSYKLDKDVMIEYNKHEDIKPLNLSELSLIAPIKKRVLLKRIQNNNNHKINLDCRIYT